MNTLAKILVALSGLAITAMVAAAESTADSGVPERADGAAGAKGMPKPVTWGMERPSSSGLLEQKVALAPSHAAGALLRPTFPGPAEVVIDVLIAYTQIAARHYHDIQREVAQLAIEQANHSFRLSGIGHIRLRLAHATQTDYVERGGHFEHVWRMADKGDEHMERIHFLREAYRADVAVLIVDDPRGCGLATRVGADASVRRGASRMRGRQLHGCPRNWPSHGCASRAELRQRHQLARHHELQGHVRRLPAPARLVEPAGFHRRRARRDGRSQQRRHYRGERIAGRRLQITSGRLASLAYWPPRWRKAPKRMPR